MLTRAAVLLTELLHCLPDQSGPRYVRCLRDDDRLFELYIEAVRRKFWPNTPNDVLEFWCLAEKALKDDKQATPGKLFYSLIKAKTCALSLMRTNSTQWPG